MKTVRLIATGRVQGVGFRPFVVRAARKSGLTGWVKNLGGIVEIRASGEEKQFSLLEKALKEAPYPIEVEKMEIETLPLEYFPDFQSIESSGEPEEPLFPADIGICPDCAKELHDKKDRHFHYPFLSCTACGPRYTIIKKLPYDRPFTTMDEFPLCKDCEKEYTDLKDRRCHGETICCEDCGPALTGIIKGERTLYTEEAMTKAIEMVQKGAIIMVKSIGGFNLVTRGDLPESVRKLRTLKHREGKPFALMVSDLEKAEELAVLSDQEKKLLASPAKPIVLCTPKVHFEGVAENVPRLGLFLPPSAFYILLTEGVGAPLIVTSCNISGSPILYKDKEAENFFKSHDIPALFTNNREILRPADDSVLKAVGNHVDFIRRTRGFLPEPVIRSGPRGNILALGADMEPSLCLTGGGYVYPGEMPCELTEEGSEEAFLTMEKDWEHMLGITPEKILCDLHPGYISENLAEKISQKRSIPLIRIQHHHAHALSVMAEHHLKGPVLAFIFDGTGYGTDGTIWGGEILLCEGKSMKRAGHLESLPLLSGDISMKQAWKTALCDLYFAGIEGNSDECDSTGKIAIVQGSPGLGSCRQGRLRGCSTGTRENEEAGPGVPNPQSPIPNPLLTDPRYPLVKAALGANVNVIEDSAMGRLFDSVSALLGICSENRFKGECAMALEKAATEAKEEGGRGTDLYFTKEIKEGQLIWGRKQLISDLLFKDGTIREKALGFHLAISRMIVESAKYFNIKDIVLSGGCFHNSLLWALAKDSLEKEGFHVYGNEKVPCGDGGIALGQARAGLMK